MKKSSLKPDLIIALMALVIGIGTMIVYVYQARIMSKQQHASVWPFLEVSISQGQLGTYVSVENKGDDVGRHQVGSELNPAKLQVQHA